jgi:TonB family protein
MNSFPICEELHQAIECMITGNTQDGIPPAWLGDVSELLEVAKDLRSLPRPDFKSRLMVELEWAASGRAMADGRGPDRPELDTLPTMSGRTNGLYPVRSANIAASAALHIALLLLLGSGLVMVKSTVRIAEERYAGVTTIDPYVPNAGARPNNGGGGNDGSGKQDPPKGESPRFAREQIAPPELNTSTSKIMVEATVIGPPELKVVKPDLGDPLSRLLALSTDTGSHAGLGNSAGHGAGPGTGPGRGPGDGGGSGGDYYLPGDGVTAPRPIYSPEPDYSDEARKTKQQGVVTILAIVGADGRPRQIQVVRSLGMGLDEKAVDAVRTWKFEPGTKDGRPVAVQICVEVSFHLF